MERYRFQFINPPPEHKALQEELKTDLDAYMAGKQKSFPISEKLRASVSRWPKVPEGKFLVVYRGQPGEYTDFPKATSFISTSLAVERAQAFKGDKCCLFEIHVQPGVPFLITPNQLEYEILVGKGVILDRKEAIKTIETDMGKRRLKVIEIVYGPAPTAGKRRRRTRTTRRAPRVYRGNT